MAKLEHCGTCNPPGMVPTSEWEYELTLAAAYCLKRGISDKIEISKAFCDIYTPEMTDTITRALQHIGFRPHLEAITDDIEDDFILPYKTNFSSVFRNPDDPDNFIQVWTDA